MRYPIFYCLLLIICKTTMAQEPAQLSRYLNSSSISINLAQPEDAAEFIASIMKHKRLFVLGEGGSHQLTLYNRMRPYLLQQFPGLNLKYFFVEYGRSLAHLNNTYIQNKTDSFENGTFTKTSYMIEMKQIRDLYQAGHQFEFRGIDMESARILYKAIKKLTTGLSAETIQSSSLLRAVLIDTSYLHYDDSSYFRSQKHFLANEYKQWQKILAEETGLLKKIMSPGDFERIVYFFANPQTKPPTGNRNTGMVKNLLNLLEPGDSNATYLMSLGIAHTLAPNGTSVIGLLQNNERLKDKIVVMNVYCDSCILQGNILKDPSLRFMNNEVLTIFREAAKRDLTIFNLSALPPEFDYIKKYGDLLLFAKDQK